MEQFLLVAGQGDAQGRQVSGEEGVDQIWASFSETRGAALAQGLPPPLPAYSRLSWATSRKLQRPHLEKLSW